MAATGVTARSLYRERSAVAQSKSPAHPAPRPGILRLTAVAALLPGAILYGSLLPFQFDAGRVHGAPILRLHFPTPEDFVVNVLVYVVLGAALFTIMRLRVRHAAPLTLGACTVLSIIVEALQVLLPQRVSSATDVVLNASGAALGIAFAACFLHAQTKLQHAATRRYRLDPLSSCIAILSIALLIYELVPFDFILGTEDLHARFRQIDLVRDLWQGLSHILLELPVATWFGLLGMLMARQTIARNDATGGAGRIPLQAVCAGGGHGILLACLIECLQLFTRSHMPELAAVLVRTLAATLGAAAVMFAFEKQGKPCNSPPRPVFSNAILLLAAAIQLLVLVWTTRAPGISYGQRFFALPFESYWRQPASVAGARGLAIIVMSGVLSATLAACLRRWGWPLWRVMIPPLVAGFHVAMPVLTSDSFTTLDCTNALLALLAAGCALRLETWLARLDQLAPAASSPKATTNQ